MVKYSQQQGVYCNPDWDIDLLKTNNSWETKTRKVAGKGPLRIEWQEFSKYWNLEKLNIGGDRASNSTPSPKKRKIYDEINSGAAPKVDPPTVSADLESRIIPLLCRLKRERVEDYTNWTNVGMILYNEFKGDPRVGPIPKMEQG